MFKINLRLTWSIWIIRPTYNSSKTIAYGTRYSQAVTHLSTNRARHCLTSQIGRDGVCSVWYGRRRLEAKKSNYKPTISCPNFVSFVQSSLCSNLQTNHAFLVFIIKIKKKLFGYWFSLDRVTQDHYTAATQQHYKTEIFNWFLNA